MLDIEAFYGEFLDLHNHVDGEQKKALCPFHQETEPSFIINPNDGKWFCFGCNEGGGPVLFTEKLLGVSRAYAQYVVDFYKEKEKLPIPDLDSVNELHQTLMKEPELISYFNKHGVSEDTLREFLIGWDINTKRIVFPIPSENTDKFFVNLRKYRPGGYEGVAASKVINVNLLGEPVLYPLKAFKEDIIYIVEGEKDMVVARAHGMNAITGTGGRGLPSFDPIRFKGKTVFIMTDADEVGDSLAIDYKELVETYAKDVTRIRLPRKDFSDTIVDIPDVRVLDYIAPFKKALTEEGVQEAKLEETYKPNNKDKVFLVKSLRVIGEHMKDYQLPKEIELSNGQKIDVPERDMLSFMDANDKVIKDFAYARIQDDEADGIYIKDSVDRVVQRLYFKEDVNIFEDSIENSERTNVTGIYIGKGRKLNTNRVYDMKLMRTTHPKTQENIYIILDAEECILDMDVDLGSLQKFKRDEPIENIIKEYYECWEPHLEVTGRQDLFTVMILTYLSVLEFKWRNSTIKGRLDSIIVGDTRTGKTKMVRNFINTLRMGEFVSGENARATGIIGGINQIKDTWSLNWGKIPINDKRLVIIDEASGLEISDITQLSQMRSEGILSITKIKSESTYARTRLLWITNPRNGRSIDEHYWKGSEALEKFLPVQEDLARFDLACSAAISDVPDIHKYTDREPMTEEELDSWRQLVLFAWNIDKEDIIFTDEAKTLIMERSIAIGDHFNNPAIFLSVNGYEKLARVGIALAVLTFNYTEGKLIVTDRHIDYAETFIRSLYEKESFGLASKVRTEAKKESITKDDREDLNSLFAIHDNLKILFRDGPMPQNMVSTILGVDHQEANRVISELYSKGLVTISGTTSEIGPTPAFLRYIREDED